MTKDTKWQGPTVIEEGRKYTRNEKNQRTGHSDRTSMTKTIAYNRDEREEECTSTQFFEKIVQSTRTRI